MDTALIVARCFLAGVFVLAGVTKLADRPGSRQAMTDFRVPAAFVGLAAVALPLLELAAAVLVLVASTARLGALLALGLLAAFVVRESNCADPLVPMGIFRSRNVTGANIIQILAVAGMFGIFFLGSLYLQKVLQYDALQIGLAFLPNCLLMAALSVRYTEPLVSRFGAVHPSR